MALAAVAALLAILSRVAIGRVAAASARVDHYYWLLAAQAYRTQRGVPVRLEGKYLLEEAEQGYPPFFGLLLGRCGLDRCGSAALPLFELLQMAAVAALMVGFGATMPSIALGLALYACAPVLVTYNTQLNSRMLGDVFLFALLAAEVFAVRFETEAATQVLLLAAAAGFTALVIMTHKMTLQLYAVLLIPWSWALGSAWPLLVFVAGALVYMAVVGRSFARYQFSAHRELVGFWNRHWRLLGAHQFRQSPVYGDPAAPCSSCFHQPGWRGVLRHSTTVLSYVPAALVMPLASAVSSRWPPRWLLVWLGVVYAWALLTLFVPRLKCLGGGHLYLFNAVGVASCYVAWLPSTPAVVMVLAAGIALTAFSLAMAWRIVGSRAASRDGSFFAALSALAVEPAGNVAVFPLQSAEAVAWATPHGVLWGGHGSGVSRLEGFFPVLTKPLSEFIHKYRIGWLLCDDRFLADAVDLLRREGVAIGSQRVFGRWRLTELTGARAAGL